VTVRAFKYVRAAEIGQAVDAVTAHRGASYLAGGTTQLDLMKDGVLEPDELVDITRLPLRGIALHDDALRIGALVTMEELAAHRTVRERLPVVREALLLSASVQLRNMATIAGNLLQRTRCRYFRDPSVACNKRVPGSGCSALAGHHRMHAILATSDHCIATHASDVAVALVALDAVVRTTGPAGERRIPLTQLHLPPGESPEVETVLAHGELITGIEVPLPPRGARSGYLKVRDRASYEFALSAAAVVLVIKDGVIVDARVGLGGVATVPWRAVAAERVLRGAAATTVTFRTAAEATLEGAVARRDNAFKIELAKRTLVRELSILAEARDVDS
jgi:xanthine dehydrogenase YagS FAD-binding subunit